LILHAETMTLAGMHMLVETGATSALRMLARPRLTRTNLYIDTS
jgi:hypothetical protein